MTSVHASASAPIGRVGRYSILAELPAGGMARVFLARKDGADALCVLKQLHVELEKHPTAATRLKREAHLISHLNHPNIARILDAGVEDDKFCMATEFVAGQMLENLMLACSRSGSHIPPAISIHIIARVLEGLDHAHNLKDPDGTSLGIVHRDLSPRNIMVGYSGEVKIIDFGVAQGKIDSFKTAPGMMVGTLRYMAPEQALTRATDQRTDLYTVAVVLYEMLTGAPVVKEGKAIQVLTSVIEKTPTPAHVENPSLPRALGEVVGMGLNKDPKDRWPSARAFRDALVEAGRSVPKASPEHIGRLVRELFTREAQEAAAFAGLAQRLRTGERSNQKAPLRDTGDLQDSPTSGVQKEEVLSAGLRGDPVERTQPDVIAPRLVESDGTPDAFTPSYLAAHKSPDEVARFQAAPTPGPELHVAPNDWDEDTSKARQAHETGEYSSASGSSRAAPLFPIHEATEGPTQIGLRAGGSPVTVHYNPNAFDLTSPNKNAQRLVAPNVPALSDVATASFASFASFASTQLTEPSIPDDNASSDGLATHDMGQTQPMMPAAEFVVPTPVVETFLEYQKTVISSENTPSRGFPASELSDYVSTLESQVQNLNRLVRVLKYGFFVLMALLIIMSFVLGSQIIAREQTVTTTDSSIVIPVQPGAPLSR